MSNFVRVTPRNGPNDTVWVNLDTVIMMLEDDLDDSNGTVLIFDLLNVIEEGTSQSGLVVMESMEDMLNLARQ
jgi:hypothetical protein